MSVSPINNQRVWAIVENKDKGGLYRSDDGELEGSFVSNAESGKYVMALTKGVYEIEVELESGEIVRDSVRLNDIKEYVVLHKDFRIYSDSSLIADNNPTLQELLNK